MARRRVWTTQPPPGTPIDWDSPLAQGLKFALTGSNVRWNSAGTDFPQSTTGGIGSSIGPSGPRADFYASSGYELFSANGLDGAISRLTLFSIWRAKPSQYLIADNKPVLLSTRNASNQGWTWGRVSAIGGGASGNLTSQEFTIQGVAEYDEANFTIPSLIDTPVACRIDSGTLSFFANGVRSSPDQSIASATTAGNSGLIFGKQGPYSGGGANWLDRAYITFAWLHALSDASIWTISRNPWQLFHRRQRFYSIATSGGSTITGSAAVDESSDIAAGSGGISIAGAGATTEGADTASGAGTVSIAGAASAAESADTASAAGTAGSSITGSGAAAEGADTGAGTGAVSISGAGAATEQRDSAGGAGSISVSATGAVHEGADAAAAAGSLSISGAANATEGTDKAAGTGSATGTLGAPGSIPSVARYTIRRQVARNFTVWRSVSRNFAVRRSLVRVFEVNSVSLRFPVKGPLEAVPLTFDFSADLPSGVTLSGAPTMSIACTEGTDANAANVVSGSVALNAAKTGVVQDGTGGLDGCEYTITCTCATTQSNLTLTLVGILAVRANLN